MNDSDHVKKIVEVNKTSTLLDLNGTKKNFTVNIKVKAKFPINRYVVAIVSQDQLDDNKFKYYNCDEDGEFSYKFSYKENKFKNYYLILKKKKDDTSENPVICSIDIESTELEVSEVKKNDLQQQKNQQELQKQEQLQQQQLQQQQLQQQQLQQQIDQKDFEEKQQILNLIQSTDSNISTYKTITIICFVCIILIFYLKNK
jgi:hypothetical protein